MVEKFIELRAQADQITADNGPSLAYFIVNIGFMLDYRRRDILEYLEFPLADYDFLPLTSVGEPFCMHELCTHLTSTKKVTCALVLEFDGLMYRVSGRIKAEHIKKEASVLSLNLDNNSCQTRLCYWPDDITVKEICDDLIAAI